MSRAALTDAFSSLQYLAGDIFDDANFDWIQIHASADELQLVGTRAYDNTWANNDVFYASGIHTIGIEQQWLPVPRFFPNPAHTTVCISATPAPERVRITDAQGRCVRDERVYNRPCTIDVADLPNGLYSMELIGAVRTAERLVVQH